MSLDGIDREYEEQLRAEARYLDVTVTSDGEKRVVRTFLDTPEGRQLAAKRADEWMELDAVTRVEVVPVGAGGKPSAGRVPASVPSSSRTQGVRAAPSRATCCRRVVLAKPSGKRLCHSLSCPDHPGESISVATYAKGREWPAVKP